MSSCECTQRSLDAIKVGNTRDLFLNPRWLIRSYGFLSLVRELCWKHQGKNKFKIIIKNGEKWYACPCLGILLLIITQPLLGQAG